MSERAYVLVNPYSMYKSRTGGVISRLLSRSSSLELIGARMFAPGPELVEEYIQACVPHLLWSDGVAAVVPFAEADAICQNEFRIINSQLIGFFQFESPQYEVNRSRKVSVFVVKNPHFIFEQPTEVFGQSCEAHSSSPFLSPNTDQHCLLRTSN